MKKKEKFSSFSNNEIKELERRTIFLTPNAQRQQQLGTPSNSFFYNNRKQLHSGINELLTEIERIGAEINEYSEENALLRKECQSLEDHMEAIANALDQNADLSEERNRNLEEENFHLRGLVDWQEDLKSQLLESYIELAQTKRINLRKYNDVNIDLLISLNDGNEIPAAAENDSTISSTLSTIVNSEPYFKNCETNDDFISKCADLFLSVEYPSSYRKPKNKGLPYEKKIERLQRYHDQTHASIANEIKTLSQKRDKLLNEIKEINRMKSETSNSIRNCNNNRPKSLRNRRNMK